MQTSRFLRGNDCISVYKTIGSNEAVIRLVADILSTSYRIHLGRKGQEFVEKSFDAIMKALSQGGSLTELLNARRSLFAKRGLLACGADYKFASLRRTMQVIGSDYFKGKVVDVGAGSNVFAEVIIDHCSAVDTVTGIDVLPNDSPPPANDNRISFLQVDSPDLIPFPSSSVDTVVARYSFHHMPYDTQIAVLAECNRILRPGGFMLMVEDSYSLETIPLACNSFFERFRELPREKDRMLVLSCLDASSSLIMNETMLFPFSFRTLEHWHAELCRPQAQF